MTTTLQTTTAGQIPLDKFFKGRSPLALLALTVSAGCAVGYLLFAFGETGLAVFPPVAQLTNLALVALVPLLLYRGSRPRG